MAQLKASDDRGLKCCVMSINGLALRVMRMGGGARETVCIHSTSWNIEDCMP